MASKIGNVVFYADNPPALAAFFQAAGAEKAPQGEHALHQTPVGVDRRTTGALPREQMFALPSGHMVQEQMIDGSGLVHSCCFPIHSARGS